MKDISIYFQPLNKNRFVAVEESLINQVQIHTEDNFPEIKEKGIALIYCPEYRNVDEVHPKGSDAFREELYKLFPQQTWTANIYDLGNLLPGKNVEDTYFALSNAFQELIKKDILPLVVGGSQDLTFGMYKAYEKLEQFVNLTTVDAKFDLGVPEVGVKNNGWLSQIVMHQPSYLFNYSNLGCQAHFNSPTTFDLFEKLYFDITRLGELNSDITLAEPVLRNTDLLSLDLESLRSSEMNSSAYNSPNGFYANEICRLARYAGMSDKLTSLGLFNLWGDAKHEVVHQLIAQIVWYFIDGFETRVGDFPMGSKKTYTTYRVHSEKLDSEIVFYKSNKSGRWWMDVPYPQTTGNKYVRHHMVPCTYSDYEAAVQNDIPNLWWKTFQKLS